MKNLKRNKILFMSIVLLGIFSFILPSYANRNDTGWCCKWGSNSLETIYSRTRKKDTDTKAYTKVNSLTRVDKNFDNMQVYVHLVDGNWNDTVRSEYIKVQCHQCGYINNKAEIGSHVGHAGRLLTRWHLGVKGMGVWSPDSQYKNY